MVATKLRGVGLALLLGAAGCGGSEGFNRNVEEKLTIAQGIYGQVTSFDDMGGETRYLPGVTINAHAVPDPGPEPPLYAIPPDENIGPPIASAVSDARGFYELALAPADYLLCALPCGPDLPRCTIVTVPAGELVRRDYEFSNAPQGWSP